MLNTIIHRVEVFKYEDHKSLIELNLLLKASVSYLADKARGYNMYGGYEIAECISEINIVLEKEYSDVFGSKRLDKIKTDALLSLNKLKSSFYKDPNNKPEITAYDELLLDLLIIEQKYIDFLKERLNKYYLILNDELIFTEQQELPNYIKTEITAVFQKYKTSAHSKD